MESALARDVEKDSSIFDFEKSFQDFLQGRQNSGITARELGVFFSNLNVVGSGSSASYHLTFESFFNPRHIYDFLNEFLRPPRKRILEGFEGVVWPGEMLLVLGRPSAGCSTFLKTLSCQTHSFSAVEGSIHLGPFNASEISSHLRGDVTYCPEDDIHFPTLTVQQTLSFAATTRTPRTLGECPTPQKFRNQFVDVLQNMLGLSHTRNTVVGNEALRGISGGEKKRVSVGEMLAVRSILGCWDNTTRGLDSSTALEMLRHFRTATSLPNQAEGRLTTIMALYQASDALYDVFDKTCVLYEGRMVYFGPAHMARAYFEELGFERASEGQTVGDFLVSVTDPKERIVRKGFESSAPRTPAEFAERFLKSELGRINREEMEKYRREILGTGSPKSSTHDTTEGNATSPKAQQLKARYMESVAQEKSRSLPKTSPFTVSMWAQLLALMKRRVHILRGSIGDQFMIFASFVVFGIVLGTVYYNSPESTDAYFSRAGALFYTVLFLTLSSMSEIPILFSQRPIVIRQYHSALYLPFLEALSQTLVDIPISFFTTLIYSIIIYFMVGLQTTAAQFFTFFVSLFALAITMKVFVRSLSAAVGSPAPAQTLAGVALLALILYTGFALPRPSMIGGLRWITYLNPSRWGFEILVSNEFHTLNATCSNLVPSGPGYSDNPNVSLANQACATLGKVPGQSTVDGNAYIALSYQYKYANAWRNLGIVFAYGVFFLLLLLLFTEVNTWIATQREVTYFARTSSGVSPLLNNNKTNDEEAGVSEKDSSAAGVNAAGTVTTKDNTKPATTTGPNTQTQPRKIFTWHHLTYDVPIAGGTTRRLLDDVSGFVAPGKLTALMGASGAGKTTLLNTLAQRASVGVVSGDVFVDGKALPLDFQAQTGYCQQLDVHLPTCTVREALSFSAKLRQPKHVPAAEKEAYVDTVLRMCGLENYEHAIVGSLNLEYSKRTTIAVELAAKPELLLFLDEPTTGLDSQSAWAIVTFLKELAQEGQAVLCTIHQPSAELFNMFDRILLLKSGGQTVYQGELGSHGRSLISYFERNGARPCPADANPAEYMLDVIGAGAGHGNTNAGTDWHKVWTASEESRQLDQELDTVLESGRKKDSDVNGNQARKRGEFASSWYTQMTTLLKRDFQRHWRDPMYLMNKLMLNIIGGVFMGFTFFQAKDTLQGTQNKVFATFMAFILSAPIGDQIHIPFIQTRSIYELRERASRVYSWTALTTAQLIAETVFNVIGSTVFFVIWYWIVGLPTDRAGYSYLMMGFTFPFFYTSFVLSLAAMAPSSLIASLLYFGLFTFAVTFTGMLQPYRRLGWWKWMYRVNPFTYLVEGFAGQAVGHAELTCSSIELVPIIPPSGMSCHQYLDPFIQNVGGYLADSSDDSSCLYCAARTTDEFLAANLNIQYSHHWRDLGVVWGYVVFNVVAVFALTYFFRIRRTGLRGLFGGRNALSND
ncbi:hypothetical protein D9758_004563 [Tetrapyrgos nigripes]|uniref:ABC transporter domain-containing protein n=1 Tax=Tetrapyrgos nigripes TaxID=182062 RepID=A0A8H5H0H0_9AGAR|nr:hypothetical protein D9758_004563 [Tetrapyrgos nigripes]